MNRRPRNPLRRDVCPKIPAELRRRAETVEASIGNYTRSPSLVYNPHRSRPWVLVWKTDDAVRSEDFGRLADALRALSAIIRQRADADAADGLEAVPHLCRRSSIELRILADVAEALKRSGVSAPLQPNGPTKQKGAEL